MILQLLAAGYQVVVWNRTREKVLPVLEAGAAEAESPANVTSQVDFVSMSDRCSGSGAGGIRR